MSNDDIYNSDYMRKLLIEAPYIRAKLENPGGSVIQTAITADTEAMNEYSAQIGNSFHLDLIETELHLSELPTENQLALRAWAEGVSAKQAALYFSAEGQVLRKRRSRGIEDLTQRMNNGTGTNAGRGSRQDTPRGSEAATQVTAKTGDRGPAQTEDDQGEGDNPIVSGK